MTTLSTRTDQLGTGVRGLLGATALTLLVVGAAAVWLARPSGGPPTAGEGGRDTIGRVIGRATPGGIPLEQYPEMVTTDPVTAPLDVPALTDGAGRYFTEQRVSVVPVTTNGMQELDGEPGMVVATPGARGGASGDCGPTFGPAYC
jgi:hypothetical protein